MGYTTDFNGHFTLDAPLTEKQAKYLNQFSGTRRIKRATGSLENLPPEVTRLVEDLPDPVREAVGLPVGPEGAYFVGSSENYGQEYDGTILEYNDPPEGQPGLWCQWIAVEDEDGAYTRIEWDGGEKFYEYTAWLEYIVENFLKPWGRTLNGEVEWQGEDRGDIGLLVVKDNVVTAKASGDEESASGDEERASVVRIIKIVVHYDESQTVPDGEDLAWSIERAVENGLLTPSGEEVIDEYYITFEDKLE
jgi:hypothetical protein